MQVKLARKMALVLLLSGSVGSQASMICDWDAFGKGILGVAALKKALRDYRKDHMLPAARGAADDASCANGACTACPTTNRMLNMSSNLIDMAAITVLAVTACQYLRTACVAKVTA